MPLGPLAPLLSEYMMSAESSLVLIGKRPIRVPLSAFIVEDMNEYVHAHATYRFVIFDEEEEMPRILVSEG